MKFAAFPRSIKTILEAERKYIIPRYQREYSWEKEQLEEFWNDIKNQITFSNESYEVKEYFIGSLVLIGDDERGTEFHVVDGQQRLTTITIFLSALTQIGKELQDDAFLNSCYRYIEGKDSDYKKFFKLINESPKPFFQNTIQNIDQDKSSGPNSDEEKSLFYAYKYFYNNLLAEKKNYDDNYYITFLKAIRDQIIDCSVIFITVDSEEAAQTIFETLNTKGKDLETLDLIKNKVFEILNKDHPSDFAKDKWKNIKNTINSRTERVSLSVFFRHFWISKYAFLNEKKIYKSFQEKITATEESYRNFLLELDNFSKNYVMVISPLETDWNNQEEKTILNSLRAIKDFRVIQPRPLITTLINLYKNKKIKQKELIKIISLLETFHFIFTAITSSRASGLESLYSKYSRELSRAEDNKNITALLKGLSIELKRKLEDIPYESFENKFINLKFSNDFTKDKKIIQYIFKLKENLMMNTTELSVNSITLEHLHSQKQDTEWSHGIGNLLPLDKRLNEYCDTKSITDKISILENSALRQVKEFCDRYSDNTEWTKEHTIKRAKILAKEIFDYAMHQFEIQPCT